MKLSTKSLTKKFGGLTAVNDVSLSFGKGQITALIGPNGSGKTTFVNSLTGVFPFDSGEVIIDEIPFKKIKTYKIQFYGMTRTFQKVRLIDQISVLENILIAITKKSLMASLFERNVKINNAHAESLLKRVALFEKKDELAMNLSYGQRKLLEIARALATKSDTYFFDEPFAGLSPSMREIVSEILKELKEEEKNIILIEHDMNLIRNLADFVYVFENGSLICQGSPSHVLSHDKVISAYLG